MNTFLRYQKWLFFVFKRQKTSCGKMVDSADDNREYAE